jgi:hypothetical protein
MLGYPPTSGTFDQEAGVYLKGSQPNLLAPDLGVQRVLKPKKQGPKLSVSPVSIFSAPAAEREVALPLEQVRKVATQSSPHTAEYCLKRAAECDQHAEDCIAPQNKAIFLDLAKRWRTLAQERQDGASLKPIDKPRASMSTG